MRSFFPAGDQVSLGADTASDSVAFSGTFEGEFQVRAYNSGTVDVLVMYSASGDTITAAKGVMLPAGAVEVLTVPNTARSPVTHAYAMTLTGTATVYFKPGHGI